MNNMRPLWDWIEQGFRTWMCGRVSNMCIRCIGRQKAGLAPAVTTKWPGFRP